MTTIPSRVSDMKKVVQSILKGYKLPTKVYLNIPYKSRKGEDYDTSVLNDIVSSKVVVNRCQDVGPITKLYPVLQLEKDPNTLILTLDDDQLIRNDLISLFMKKSIQYPFSVLSLSGYCMSKSIFAGFQPVIQNLKDVEVDWVQGVHGILYRRWMLNEEDLLSYPRDHFEWYKNDDHWIAYYLHKKKIPLISLGEAAKSYYKQLPTTENNGISSNKLPFYLWSTKNCNLPTKYKNLL